MSETDGDGTSGASRRHLLAAGGLAAAAGAGALALGATGSAAASGAGGRGAGALITRRFPASGERIPVIGLGTFMTFDTLPGAPRGHLRDIVRRFLRAGGAVIDTSPLYGAAEANTGWAIAGAADDVFLTNKIWSTGEYLWDDSHALRSLERSMERLSRDRPLSVVTCHNLVNVDVVLPLLHAWRKEGRIRHLGVTHHDTAYFDLLADWVERGALDSLQVRYSIRTRDAERRVLPAAADHGTAVMVNMPLEKGRLHAVVGDRPLPDEALELGIDSWAELFLKWVVAHPAVTCALPATSRPEHLEENVRAMRGALPDPGARERLAATLAGLPGFADIETAPWYPGKSYPGLVSRAQAALRERSPWWPS
ncbi:aldo/keto reductase [Streptomyces radicis]|uniref:Aldo/keto reductase n=1 Tax=Streptomyces radicis TaxID=1750517 RepID=A0A3A9WH24_9ACTN|nr:aldo/keto reductase [Streptomyces radicis]RKN11902.1 aldo/keto reductase [Streptomyces radicis]RKN26048.1 aldo/keto reductase [Streptomyces radicis]